MEKSSSSQSKTILEQQRTIRLHGLKSVVQERQLLELISTVQLCEQETLTQQEAVQSNVTPATP